ncbi:hypothetical protein QIA41_05115 (plasmid) [Borreliella sinica]
MYIYFFIFLNSCIPNFKTNQEGVKYPSNEKKSKSNTELAFT